MLCNSKIGFNKNHIYESVALRNYSMYTKLLNSQKQIIYRRNKYDVVAY